MGLVTLTFVFFDLETGMSVASKVGTFLPNLGTRGRYTLGSRVNHYVRDGRTDKSKAFTAPSVRAGGHNKHNETEH